MTDNRLRELLRLLVDQYGDQQAREIVKKIVLK